jgi:hypothetical protein
VRDVLARAREDEAVRRQLRPRALEQVLRMRGLECIRWADDQEAEIGMIG